MADDPRKFWQNLMENHSQTKKTNSTFIPIWSKSGIKVEQNVQVLPKSGIKVEKLNVFSTFPPLLLQIGIKVEFLPGQVLGKNTLFGSACA